MTRRRLLLVAALALGAARAARGAWLAAAADATPGDIPLDGDGTGWRVRATVNGALRGTFLIDTGASLCVLSPEFARRANARQVVGHVDLRTANGIIRAPLVRLRMLEIGDVRARGVEAVVHAAAAAPIDGVLGLNFLNQFAYAIDPKRRTLRLR
jgi:clan AA aspartic protease (TIGR02281 family)